MDRYQPSKYISELHAAGRLWPCPGLSNLVLRLQKAGYEVAIDMSDDGIPELEQVNSKNVVRAVNEVDMANLWVMKDGERSGVILVIPSNDGDWLTDYSYRQSDLEFQRHMEETL